MFLLGLELCQYQRWGKESENGWSDQPNFDYHYHVRRIDDDNGRADLDGPVLSVAT